LSVILLLDGYRTYGEGAHRNLLSYVASNSKTITGYEMSLIDDLRAIRNRIAYDGFFVDKDYLARKAPDIRKMIQKLRNMVDGRM